ncbi:MAG: cell division protein FtsZ [Prolixibacteraceae bacterium]|nr:cell division protein FtsZ [Prolixibacteraceae bacterium]
MSEDILNFNCEPNIAANIKVIGVGGGGGNAVNYMFQKGIADVGFIICNTDGQALKNSPVPIKVQLGESLTMGRGAGNQPELGEQAAIENIEDVKAILSDNTNMAFITAGMGGGTGTGAAPVIAKVCRELNILTIAVVTVPSRSEGRKRYEQALKGVENIREHVDSLLVINNEKIRDIYGNLPASQAFAKADEILTTAVKGVAEIITLPGNINIDFADVHTVMSGSKVFIMGTGYAEGENRAILAAKSALESPLLDSNDIYGTQDILLNITSGNNEITIGEIGEIIEFLQEKAGSDANIIWGNGYDKTLGDKISVTIIATGFKVNPSAILQNFDKEPEQYFNLNQIETAPVFEEEKTKVETLTDEFEMESVEIDIKEDKVRRGNEISSPEQSKKADQNKKKEVKIENWFMRQFNSLFEENSAELE